VRVTKISAFMGGHRIFFFCWVFEILLPIFILFLWGIDCVSIFCASLTYWLLFFKMITSNLIEDEAYTIVGSPKMASLYVAKF
jgi:hypothetical protein